MKNTMAYVIALILSVMILFGSHKAEAHSDRDVAIGAIVGLGIGLAIAGNHRRHHRHHRHHDYFPTGPSYYPHNYFIPGHGYVRPHFRKHRKFRHRNHRHHH